MSNTRMYHASFKGRKLNAFGKPLRRIAVILTDTSIYNIKERVKERYEFVSGLCVTSCEGCGLDFFELKS